MILIEFFEIIRFGAAIIPLDKAVLRIALYSQIIAASKLTISINSIKFDKNSAV